MGEKHVEPGTELDNYTLERLATYPTNISRTLYGKHHRTVTPANQHRPGEWHIPGMKDSESFSEAGHALLNLAAWVSGHGLKDIRFLKPLNQSYWTVEVTVGGWNLVSSEETISVKNVLYEPNRGHAPIKVVQWAALVLTGLEVPLDDHVGLPWPIPAAFIATYGKHVSDEVAAQLAVDAPSVAFNLFEQGCRVPEVIAIAATHESKNVTGNERLEDTFRFDEVFLSLTTEEYDATFPHLVERLANGPVWQQELLVDLKNCPSEVLLEIAEKSPRIRDRILRSRLVSERTRMLVQLTQQQ